MRSAFDTTWRGVVVRWLFIGTLAAAAAVYYHVKASHDATYKEINRGSQLTDELLKRQ